MTSLSLAVAIPLACRLSGPTSYNKSRREERPESCRINYEATVTKRLLLQHSINANDVTDTSDRVNINWAKKPLRIV